MIKVTKKLSIFTVLVLTICLLAGSVFAFAADNKVYTIRFAHGYPATHWRGIEMANWAKMINEESNGRLKVEVFPAGQLFNTTKIISAVKTGACEMGAVFTFNLATIIPEFKVFAIPGVVEGRDCIIKILKGEIGKNLFSKIEDKGIKPLGCYLYGISGQEIGIMSKFPVHIPSDLKGAKIRVHSSEQTAYFEEYCGANSVSLAGSELYMGLQRGTINCALGSTFHVVDRKISEVAPYFSRIPADTIFDFYIMNNEFYNKLPEDLQNLLINTSYKVQKESYEKTYNLFLLYELKAKEAVKGRGEIYTPTPEEYALWTKNIEDFWKRVTQKEPEVYDVIMEIQKLK